jgi:hypothetical protein
MASKRRVDLSLYKILAVNGNCFVLGNSFNNAAEAAVVALAGGANSG